MRQTVLQTVSKIKYIPSLSLHHVDLHLFTTKSPSPPLVSLNQILFIPCDQFCIWSSARNFQ